MVYTKKRHVSFSLIVLVITCLFLLLPLFVIIIFSFNESKGSLFTHFSLKWYKILFTDSRDLLKALANSLFIAFCAATTSSLIATLAAIGVKWHNFKGKKYIELITYLPLILPDVILGISFVLFFSGFHIPLGLFTIYVAHTTFCIPFVYLTVFSRLSEFDHSIVDAARDLGASEVQTLVNVIIPIILPGVFSGFVMAITLSLEDFIITFFVSGPGSTTLPIYLYSLIRFGITPVINAISCFMVLSLSIIAITLRHFLKDIAISK